MSSTLIRNAPASGSVREIRHGGRLREVARQYGGRTSEWLDLSTGINPTSWPVPELPQAVWHRLPEPEDEEEACEAARQAWNVDPAAEIAVAGGTQAIINTLPHLFAEQPVAVLSTTYAEHAHRWQMGGHAVVAADRLETATASARIVVVVNPNNPDGRLLSPDRLLETARRLRARNGCLVVDEAYADVCEEFSLAARASAPGLIVLRSLGKFHGLAGARIGFALGHARMIDQVRRALGPWPAGGASLAIARAALLDRTWRKRMQRVLGERRRALENVLDEAKLEVIGGTDLFLLVEDENAEALNERLLGHRILARRFETRPNALRFGLPGGTRALERLRSALLDTP